jgi:hypothetical protein
MSGVRPSAEAGGGRRGGAWLLGLVVLLSGAGPAAAAEKAKGSPAQGAVLGESAAPAGTLLVRSAGSAWRVLPQGGKVHDGDELVALAGARADVNLKSQGLRLALVGVLPEFSPSPALESAVRLHRAQGGGLDLTLKRGRVLLENTRPKASARVHFLKETWEVTLSEPATEVALELYGAWPAGVKLPKKAGSAARPNTQVFLMTLKGRATVSSGSEERALPALALYQWSTAAGTEGPVPLRELPPFLLPRKDTPEQAKAITAGVERLRDLLAGQSGPLTDVFRKALDEQTLGARRAAVYAAGAIGDVELLLTALGDAKHGDVRESAVLMLRHWLGHGEGHAAKLYQDLLARNYTPGQAETLLYLLHRFSRQDRARPETADTLIDYLQHRDLRIRELAGWQLYHLIPAGHSITYNPAGPPEERAQAQARWRQLIRQGLPPEKTRP